METLKIEKANALKAHDGATDKGKELLENLFGKNVFLKDIKDRIKNFEDVLKEAEISKAAFAKQCTGLEADEIAYKKAKLVCSIVNEGWVPDWKNSNQYKYFPWFNMNDSSSDDGFSYYDCVCWDSLSYVGSRLCFKSSDLATFAGKLFEQEIYKPLFII